MALRTFSEITYAPLLELRPAEMVALESLPEKDKDLLLPFFKLRPWLAAHELASAVGRLKSAYGNRPCFLSLGEHDVPDVVRPVHRDLARLGTPADGFKEWCEFFSLEANAQFIPCLQLTDAAEFDEQARRLYALNRGVGVVIEYGALPFADVIAERLAAATNGGEDAFLVLDFARQGQSMTAQASDIKSRLAEIHRIAPSAVKSVSASSFPESFTTIASQEIFERTAFEKYSRECEFRVVYSDRGSARAERQNGGGGAPAPRIDYAADQHWYFHRSSVGGDRLTQYQQMAIDLIGSPYWDAKLRLWGTQMIERTALGDREAITSPPRATAARINLHLHRQLHFGNPAALYDTEDEWVD